MKFLSFAEIEIYAKTGTNVFDLISSNLNLDFRAKLEQQSQSLS